ncbi:MAG: hypothetical protein K0S65_6132 [Labilithrix sp.]|nr:hypothetical protein [Labilithrix sp.]
MNGSSPVELVATRVVAEEVVVIEWALEAGLFHPGPDALREEVAVVRRVMEAAPLFYERAEEQDQLA